MSSEPEHELLTDDALAAVLVHGLHETTVVLTDNDPRWPARFAHLAAQLREALGARARLLEHIGSTSVPGLAAKPVIDILLGIDDPEDEPAYLPDLRSIGYDLRVREPQHRCLRLEEPGQDAANLHCYRTEDPEVANVLLFRDWLRTHEDDRRRYEATKRSLARREWRDMNYYAEAKGPVIGEILRRARPPKAPGGRHTVPP